MLGLLREVVIAAAFGLSSSFSDYVTNLHIAVSIFMFDEEILFESYGKQNMFIRNEEGITFEVSSNEEIKTEKLNLSLDVLQIVLEIYVSTSAGMVDEFWLDLNHGHASKNCWDFNRK